MSYEIVKVGAVYQRVVNSNPRYQNPLKGVEARIRLRDENGTIIDGRLTVWDSGLYDSAEPTGPVSTNATGTFERQPIKPFKLELNVEKLVVSNLNGQLILEDDDTLVRVGYIRLFNNDHNNTSGPKKPEHDM